MVDPGFVPGLIGWGVARTLDQVINYVAEASKCFDHCQDLQNLLRQIRPLVLAALEHSNAAASSSTAPLPPSGGAAAWLRDLKPELEAAEEHLKEALLWLAKRKQVSFPLDVFKRHKWSRSIRKITKRILNAAHDQGPFANLESTLYTSRVVNKIHAEVSDLTILWHTNLNGHMNELIEDRIELVESRLTKLVHTEFSRIERGDANIVDDVKGVIVAGIVDEVKTFKSWQRKAFRNVQKQRIIEDESQINDFTARFDHILSNLNEQAASQQEKHQVDGSSTHVSTAVKSTVITSVPLAVEKFSIRPPVSYSFRILEVATNSFANKNVLGRGSSAIVFKGVLSDGQRVAVKRFNQNISKQNLEWFLSEVRILGQCEHPNLVNLYGYCREEVKMRKVQKLSHLFRAKKESIFALVFEYLESKTVASFLFGDNCLLHWPTRFNIVLGIARGLVYLHDTRHIVHCDIKANNILLDAQFCPKIADFGISKLMDDVSSVTNVNGTLGYIDPEFLGTGRLSSMVDVYSFGILLLEIVSGKHCWESHEELRFLSTWARRSFEKGGVQEVVEKLLDPKLSIEVYPTLQVFRVVHVSLLCVQPESTNRPTMLEALSMLLEGMDLKPITSLFYTTSSIS